jgi:virginiamycin B lyase
LSGGREEFFETAFGEDEMRRLMLVLGAVLGLVQGAAAATTQVYTVPAGAKPHDVAPGPDGVVWYTAQGQGALGILYPETGRTVHVALGEGSAPHGVIQGPDGAAWVTDSGLNAIVRVDPKTQGVKVWKLPEARGYANLNTAAFDGEGKIWFTGQNGIYGRLDPASGEMKVWDAPRGRGPYGIDATPSGEIFYVSLAGSHLARIDRKSGEATVLEPPTPKQGARRVWADGKGALWISEWNTGQLTRYSPATGTWKSWKMPGEAPRAYAVYVDEKDLVWVTDWGSNVTRTFDPATETFTAAYPGRGQCSADSGPERRGVAARIGA